MNELFGPVSTEQPGAKVNKRNADINHLIKELYRYTLATEYIRRKRDDIVAALYELDVSKASTVIGDEQVTVIARRRDEITVDTEMVKKLLTPEQLESVKSVQVDEKKVMKLLAGDQVNPLVALQILKTRCLLTDYDFDIKSLTKEK